MAPKSTAPKGSALRTTAPGSSAPGTSALSTRKRGRQTVPTPAGDARVTYAEAAAPKAVLVLGHGAGGGIEARDLGALAAALPGRGITVALVEQPWRVAGKRLAPAPKTLDTAWAAVWTAVREALDGSGRGKPPARGLPLVAGGRSAGARVACRTGQALGAAAVLALAFPLHPPGRPERSRAAELLGTGLPTLVVQGGRDPFGAPEEFARAGYGGELVPVPHGDHGFAVPKRADTTEERTLTAVTDAVARWLETVLAAGGG